MRQKCVLCCAFLDRDNFLAFAGFIRVIILFQLQLLMSCDIELHFLKLTLTRRVEDKSCNIRISITYIVDILFSRHPRI